jgi:hypothetical protein
VTRGPRPDSPWPSHIKYTTMVGITICIVIRLQESVVACVLQPWSGGKDPDRYIPLESPKALQKLRPACLPFRQVGLRLEIGVPDMISIHCKVNTFQIASPHTESVQNCKHFFHHNIVIQLCQIQFPGLESHRMTFLQ